jgi:outer membrane protein assembly factor BamA
MQNQAVAMMIALLSVSDQVAATAQPDSTRLDWTQKPKFEIFPIISFDTDAGFGYGAKAFLLNFLGADESFDVTVFNSSKGERWYRFVASLPDFERRQGSEYPIALDIVLDYDKWINSSFFGVGGNSLFDNREFYTKEPFELSITISRGFTPSIVGQAGVRYRFVRNFNFEEGSRLQNLAPPLNRSRVSYVSLFTTIRYDTRNSYVNATDGEVLQLDAETAPPWQINDVKFVRLIGWLQWYRKLLGDLVLAVRGGMGGLLGDDLPVQVLLPVGGGNTVRGSPQDRLLDYMAAVVNIEFRFRIIWRLGGLVGADGGRVWHRVREMGFSAWQTNVVAGLRFLMDTFVVRLDVGLGRETTGFYLNFGQLF